MTIPSAKGFWTSVLEVLNEATGATAVLTKNVVGQVLERSNLTEEERTQKTSTGKLLARNRVEWAITQLRQEGLLENESRGRIFITESGKAHLKGDTQVVAASSKELEIETPPDELMAQAHDALRRKLAQDLLENLQSISWDRFEHLCVHLLEKMGYGRGVHLGQTGDEGVDGLINQDALGLERVYVQAKRWVKDKAVGEPEIRNFSGSLVAKGAKKGVLITSSQFNNHARQSADSITKGGQLSIILVEGLDLANLMIEYGVGVVTEQNFEIKKLDENYFAEDV